MKVQRATIETRTAFLFTEFGLSYAVKLFGRDAIDALPHYARGKHKSQPKGVLVWEKCTVGGWVREAGYGHVQVPGFVEARIEISEGWGYGQGSAVAMKTRYPTYEIKVARETEHEIRRLAALAEQQTQMKQHLLRQVVVRTAMHALHRERMGG